MQVPFVDLKGQYLTIKEDIDRAIDSVLSESAFVGGSSVKEFETNFAALYGTKHAIGVGNGTDAIYIVLKMLGIGPGDEVITTASSWISTSETISQTGARPVFVDIHPDTFTIHPALIEQKISDKTKAVLPVHLYGHIAHMSEISSICKKHQLLLIEDCAQSHFSAEVDVLAGTFGLAGTFSFYPTKNLGAYGDAGCIITNDDMLANRCRMYANHGGVGKNEHMMEGTNSRLDSMQAAILNVKLKHISDWTNSRIENAQYYNELLRSVNAISLPGTRENTRHTFHLYVIRTMQRDQLRQYLRERGVQTSIHYPKALPNLPAYSYMNHSMEDFPVASQYQNEVLSLPMFPELSLDQIEYVCHQIRDFFK